MRLPVTKIDLALGGFLVTVAFLTLHAERPLRPELPEPVMRMQAATDRRITSVFGPPVSPWVAGILLGDDSGFSRDRKEAFRATGTSHLTAVSGYNIAVLIGILGSASSYLPLSRPMRLLGGGSVILLFVLLTGAPASVVRAAVMAGLVVLARLAGRHVRPLRALFLAAILMAAHRPELLLHDLGFQLSVLATFGLVVFSPILESPLRRILPGAIAQPFAQTAAATVTVAPLIATSFGTFSLVTLPANMLVGASVPPLMAVSAILLGLSWLSMPFAQILASFLRPLFMAPLRLVDLAASVPHAELIGMSAYVAAGTTSVVVVALAAHVSHRQPHVEEE